MTITDIAFALIPGMILLLAIGIGGDAIARFVGNIATSRSDVAGLTRKVGVVRGSYNEAMAQLEARKKVLQEVESQLGGVQRELASLRQAEAALADPHNNTVFEIGRPLAGSEGWYVKLLLHRKHDMFAGLGTTSTNSEGYRLGRLVYWGVDADTVAQLCRQRFSKEASVLSIKPFRGKLMRTDV